MVMVMQPCPKRKRVEISVQEGRNTWTVTSPTAAARSLHCMALSYVVLVGSSLGISELNVAKGFGFKPMTPRWAQAAISAKNWA